MKTFFLPHRCRGRTTSGCTGEALYLASTTLLPVRNLLLFLFAFCLNGLTFGQAVYNVRETLIMPDGVPATGGTIYARLPLNTGGQEVSQDSFSVSPQGSLEEGFQWSMDQLRTGDSLRFSYRVRIAPILDWNGDSLLAQPGLSIAWLPTADAVDAGPYILPPLVRADTEKTDLRTLSPADTTVEEIDRLIRRMGRRIKIVRSLDRFDYGQPLLQDLYQRQTTPPRKHLLLSLALQYLDVPHRVVAGKVLSYGEVRENELWIEIPVGDRWWRVYYGDGTDRSEWGAPDEPDRFLTCAYDWRALTLEVVSSPGSPPIPSVLTGRYDNLIVEFWVKKDQALSRKRYAQAVGYLDSMLTYLPGSVIAISEIGLVYTEAGRAEEGLKYLQEGLRLAANPLDRGTALFQFAKYYSLQRQPDAAVQALARAYTLASFDLSVIYTDPRFQYLSKQPNIDSWIWTTVQSMY